MKDFRKDDKYPYYGYEDLLESFGIEVIKSEAVGRYDGDYLNLFKDGNRYGYLMFGYGSCSGCDALEAINNDYEQVKELRDGLFESIRWGTASELVEYLESDEVMSWWKYDEEIENVGKEFITYLKGQK